MKASGQKKPGGKDRPGYELKEIPVDSVKRPGLELRHLVDEGKMEELRCSIKAHGVLVPLIVREVDEGYELIAGLRRLICSAAIGLATVPAIVVCWDAEESLWATVTENLHREGVNAVDVAHYIASVLERFHLSHGQAAERLGVGLAWLEQRLGLLRWPEDVRNAVREGWVSFAVGRELVGIKSDGIRRACIDTARRAGCSVRQAAMWRRNWAKERQGTTAADSGDNGVSDEEGAEFGHACILCDKVTAREDGTIVFLCSRCQDTLAGQKSALPSNPLPTP